MLRTRFEWTILLILASLLGSAWITISKESITESSFVVLNEAPIVGHPAPDFTLTTAVSQTHTLSDYAGRPIVLNFWATWCAPCRIEMPHLQEASEIYNGRVTFLGVNDGEAQNLVTDFADEFDLTYPLLLDNGRTVQKLLQRPWLTSNLLHNVVMALSLKSFIGADKSGYFRRSPRKTLKGQPTDVPRIAATNRWTSFAHGSLHHSY